MLVYQTVLKASHCRWWLLLRVDPELPRDLFLPLRARLELRAREVVIPYAQNHPSPEIRTCWDSLVRPFSPENHGDTLHFKKNGQFQCIEKMKMPGFCQVCLNGVFTNVPCFLGKKHLSCWAKLQFWDIGKRGSGRSVKLQFFSATNVNHLQCFVFQKGLSLNPMGPMTINWAICSGYSPCPASNVK